MLARKRTEQVIIDTDSYEESTSLYRLALGDLGRIMAVGAVVGLLVWVVASLLFKFVFVPVLCRPIAPTDCAAAPAYGLIAGLIIANIGGLIALVRLRLARPLLVVLAASIALWPLGAALAPLAWGWTLLAFIVLWVLAYAVFGWINRSKSFILALVLTVVVVFLARLALL